MFFVIFSSKNLADSHKIWYWFSWIYLPQRSVCVFPLTWIMSVHYLVKLAGKCKGILWVHYFKFEVLHISSVVVLKKLTPVLMPLILIVEIIEKNNCVKVLHGSLFMRVINLWNVDQNVWKKVTITQRRTCKLKIQQKSNISIKQLFKMLCPHTNVHSQPWLALIECLVNNALIHLSPDRDEVMHWKPYFSVVLACNNAYQLYPCCSHQMFISVKPSSHYCK